MNALKDTLKSYQKNLDRGEFFFSQDKYENALKYYNQAIVDLYNAKEMCEYSDELLATNDSDMQTWLKNKSKSINIKLQSLVKYTKELQNNINYAVTLNKTTKVPTPRHPQNRNQDSQDNSRRNTRRNSGRDNDSRRGPNEKNVSHTSHTSHVLEMSSILDDPAPVKNRRRSSIASSAYIPATNWEELAEQSIKLLCHLRSKYDFKDKDLEFERIFRQRQVLLKREIV